MKICLDAGHFGKYNPSPIVKGYYEAEMAWKLHLLLKAELESYGCEVITTRGDQAKDMEVSKRGKAAQGCDLFISLHSNATADGATSPDYPIVYGQISGVADALAEKLANRIADVMQTKQSGRVGHRKGNNGDYYGVLRGSAAVGVPGLLIEHSFHTNERSAKWLMDESNLRQLAQAEAEVIAKHYGLQKPKVDKLYRVQVGAFRIRENAEAMVRKIKEAGFEAFVTESE
ncbi:MAG: N-acetylmuramoyl-L-alanine amidase [Ruminococcus sp.]|nr:N-acetylmuramoyl-L-alanine amidase [Ruminococcus sp.]